MMTRRQFTQAFGAAFAFVAGGSAVLVRVAHALASTVESELRTSKYVYISTQRKDGSYGKPAEIWFLYHDGAVWVASPTTTWRVKRIRAGRPKAKIAVGKIDGTSFPATGSIVKDEKVYDIMYKTFAEKYPDGWPKYEQRFRDGLKDGTRVLMKYQPSE